MVPKSNTTGSVPSPGVVLGVFVLVKSDTGVVMVMASPVYVKPEGRSNV